jgi:hypothetical protein
MKTITIIIASVLTLGVFSVFASGTDVRSGSSTPAPAVVSAALAPVTPAEATFEEASFAPSAVADVMALAPVTPAEASFELEAETVIVPALAGLAPVMPAEADFSDAAAADTGVTALAPVAPATADFEDIP